jgi:hypothetical protein
VNFKKRKEVKTMKYKTPELTALTPAINAVQSTSAKSPPVYEDSIHGDPPEADSGFVDWE